MTTSLLINRVPFTRHFYSVDEVHAALQYSSHRQEHQQTLFWCKELLCSGFVSETISTLFESWIWHRGPVHLEWFIFAWKNLGGEEVTEDAILLSAQQLSRCCKRDYSLWNILVLTLDDTIPDHVTPKSPNVFPSVDPVEQYFIRAVYQGKARCAWWISRKMGVDRVWELLEWFTKHIQYASIDGSASIDSTASIVLNSLQNYDKLLGYRSEEYDIVISCLAIISICTLCNTKSLIKTINMTSLDHKTLEKWDTKEGYMERRLYSIPSTCLYGVTYRGNLPWSQHNRGALDCVENGFAGCPFWERVVCEYARGVVAPIPWVSGDSMEAFYNEYFPDDIPDEWTMKEKQKSHGDGVLGPSENSTLLKYSKIHMSGLSRLAWNTTDIVHRILANISNSECHPSAIVRLFTTPCPVILSELIPKRKHFRISVLS